MEKTDLAARYNLNPVLRQMSDSERQATYISSQQSADFLRRSMRMTALLLIVGPLFALIYAGTWPALAILSGGAWSLVNLIFLSAMVRAIIIPGSRDIAAIAGLALIKFPALYITGYFLLTFSKFDAIYLLIGFSVFFVVVILKSLGRAMLHLDGDGVAAKKQSVLN